MESQTHDSDNLELDLQDKFLVWGTILGGFTVLISLLLFFL